MRHAAISKPSIAVAVLGGCLVAGAMITLQWMPAVETELLNRRNSRVYVETRYGWPWTYHAQGLVRDDWRTYNTASEFYRGGLVANSAVGVAMSACTVVCLVYWCRLRQNALRFGLRTTLFLTLAAAVYLGCLKAGDLRWADLLFVPIAVGVVSIPAALGIGLEGLLRRADNRWERMRKRFLDAPA